MIVPVEAIASIALWFVGWPMLLRQWHRRRLDSQRSALIITATQIASFGLPDLVRGRLDPWYGVVLLALGAVMFLFVRYLLGVIEDDRPPTTS
jgi:hypothetical protein